MSASRQAVRQGLRRGWTEFVQSLRSPQDQGFYLFIGVVTLAVLATVEVGERPRGIALSRDGKSLYICTSDSDRIEELDLATLKVKRILPSGPDPARSRPARASGAAAARGWRRPRP